MTHRFLLSVALLACIGAASAQQAQPSAQPMQQQAVPIQPALTAEQRAQIAKHDAEMSQAALHVMEMVDANHTGEVWDGASATMKQVISRADFVRQITADRTRLGKLTARGDPALSRSQFGAGAKVPPGIYINVAVPTTFAHSQKPIRELVSFRLDEDKTWRVSGYTLR